MLIFVSICLYVCVCVCGWVCTHVCVYVLVYMCMCACLCLCQVIVHEVPGQELEVEVYDKDPDQDDFLGRYYSLCLSGVYTHAQP